MNFAQKMEQLNTVLDEVHESAVEAIQGVENAFKAELEARKSGLKIDNAKAPEIKLDGLAQQKDNEIEAPKIQIPTQEVEQEQKLNLQNKLQ
jgi:hypothetical protein